MRLYTAFSLNNRIYGIPIEQVQEVVMPLPVAKFPLAPSFVEGLINLRGNITTSILLNILFQEESTNSSNEHMNIVCRLRSGDISFNVDHVEDVALVDEDLIRPVPDSIPWPLSSFLGGVYSQKERLLCIINLDAIEANLNGETSISREETHDKKSPSRT